LGYIGLYNKPPPPVINGSDYINKVYKLGLKRWTELFIDENKSKTDAFTPKTGQYCRLTNVDDGKTDRRKTYRRSTIRLLPVMGRRCAAAGEVGEEEDKAPVVVG
jgi:hypothetical protein